MKPVLILFTSLLIGGSTQAQTGTWNTSATTWYYNFGNNTGIGQLNGAAYTQGAISTSTKTAGSGYLPSPSSGNARLSGHNAGYARWSLTGTPTTPRLRFASSHSGRVGKFSLFQANQASPVTSIHYTLQFNDSTTTAANWQFAFGNTTTYGGTSNLITGTGGITGSGTTAAPELFGCVRWQMTGGNFTLAYRQKTTDTATITYQTISTLPFVKGGTYNMEFYCNNSPYAQSYTHSSTVYTLPAHTFHIWANHTRLQKTTGIYEFPGGELPPGEAIDGMVFTGQTSTSGSTNDNSAVMYLNNITVKQAVDSAALHALASQLPAQPKGFGLPYQHRTQWDSLRLTGNYGPLLTAANTWRSQPLPIVTDSIYRLYWTAGNSQSAKTIMTDLRDRLSVFTWAELLLNDDSYLPIIRTTISAMITQRSWNFPSEDRDSANFTGTQYNIGLCAAAYAHELAQVLYLLHDKLPDSVHQQVKQALELRIFQPTLQGVANGNANKEFVSLLDKGNHNAACLSGVTGAALTVLPNAVERARFLQIALQYIPHYVSGFTADGYCSEGLSYYNYGFGYFIQLREKILQETSGGIDLFTDPKMRQMAMFAPRSEMINELYPTIADCNPGMKPSRALLYYVNRCLDLGLTNYQQYDYLGRDYSTLAEMMYAFPNAATQATSGSAPNFNAGIRSFFNVAGILTVRPDSTGNFQTAAVFKGGHNGEMHNHNDVGSFTIASGNAILMGDPGAIPYTAKTFNDQRYTYKTLNSYGHPVPVVNGKLQRTGSSARAVITDTLFTDTLDRIGMDITTVYKDSVPSLNLLKRTFTYKRGNDGLIQVKDTFSFSSAASYASVITTRVNWRVVSPSAIELYSGLERLRVDIQAPAGGYTIVAETVSEEGGLPYKRLAFQLNNTVTNGTLTLTFTRAAADSMVHGKWTGVDSSWIYKAGTNTGTGQLNGVSFNQGTVVNTTTAGGVQGFMPYPTSGSVRLGGITDGLGKARWWLEGDSANALIRFASSNGGKVGKLAMYDMAHATPVTSIFYTLTFNDSTTTQCNWQFAIGRTAGSTASANRINGTSAIPGSGTTSTPEIFAAVRWLMENSTFTFAYRDKPNAAAAIVYNTVSNITFVKGGTYNMEFYCNNAATTQSYTRAGITYSVPAHSFHTWANSTQLATGSSVDFPGGELPAGSIIDGFTFTGQTSISGATNNNAAQFWLGNIQVDHRQETTGLRKTAGIPQQPDTQMPAAIFYQQGNRLHLVTQNEKPGSGILRLVDISGKQVLQQKVNWLKGSNHITLPLPPYCKGTYLLSVQAIGKPIKTYKIVL